ncbi:MAG: hypothetical protein AAFQ94_14060 [Bacteroidota bacterium]
MKYTFLFILFLSSAIVANAQEAKADSTETTITKVIETDNQDSQEKQDPPKKEVKKEKEGFGDTLLSLGKGFMERLKYRFNLEAVENKVEKAQQKFKKKEDKKRGS